MPLVIAVLAVLLIGGGIAIFFVAGGTVAVTSPITVKPPPSNSPEAQAEYEITTNMVRSRLVLILTRPSEKAPQDLEADFPHNLRPDSRAKWIKFIKEGDQRYVSLEKAPAEKAHRAWREWVKGVGKDMPDSVREERMDEIFAICFESIIGEIERAEGIPRK